MTAPDMESINLTLVELWVDTAQPIAADLMHDTNRHERLWQRTASTCSVATPPAVLPDVLAALEALDGDMKWARDVYLALLPSNPSGIAITETSILNELRDPDGPEAQRDFINDLADQADSTGDPQILDQWHTHILQRPDSEHDAMRRPAAYADWPAAREAARRYAVSEWERLHEARATEFIFGRWPESGERIDEYEAQMDLYANNLDNFRRNLSPEDQAAYDEWLDTVRDDENISFVIDPSVPAGNEATVDLNIELTYRGIATPTFSDPDAYERTINEDTPREITFLGQPPVTSAGTTVGAIITEEGWTIEYDETSGRAESGSGAIAVHETVHWLQDGDPIPASTHPNPFVAVWTDVLHEAQLNDILIEARDNRTTDPLGIYLDGRYGPIGTEGPGLDRWQTPAGPYNVEPYAVFADMFYSDPELLQDLSPEAYELMVSVTGVDVLAP